MQYLKTCCDVNAYFFCLFIEGTSHLPQLDSLTEFHFISSQDFKSVDKPSIMAVKTRRAVKGQIKKIDIDQKKVIYTLVATNRRRKIS